MNGPLISVVIPAYNAGRYIAAAVRSALAQTWPELEVVVVDNGSTDETVHTLAQIRDARLRVFDAGAKNGVSAARNLGVRQAQGAYIAFLDADDAWEQDKLARQMDSLRVTGAAFSFTARQLISDGGAPTGRVIGVPERVTYRSLLRHNVVTCSSVLLPAETARAFPMERDDLREDYLTWLRILKADGSAFAAGLDTPLTLYRMSAAGASRNKWRMTRSTYGTYRALGVSRPRALSYTASHTLAGIQKFWLRISR